jgi:hypothetical protein
MTELEARNKLTSDEAKEVFDIMVKLRGGPFATNELLVKYANAWTWRLEQKTKFLFEEAMLEEEEARRAILQKEAGFYDKFNNKSEKDGYTEE